MSYSPPPFIPEYPGLAKPTACGLSHPDNVPSADITTYFHRTLTSEHALGLTEDTRIPASYWQWPTAQDLANVANEEAARREARGTRGSVVALPFVNVTPAKQTMSGIRLRILKEPEPPHINWKQRAVDVVENAKKEAESQEVERQALEAQRRAHAEMIKSGKTEL
jgi:hypothetical protein